MDDFIKINKIANEIEKAELNKQYHDIKAKIYCIESDNEKYFIACARMKVEQKKVVYERENNLPRNVRG